MAKEETMSPEQDQQESAQQDIDQPVDEHHEVLEEEPTIETLQAEIESLHQELDTTKEQALRTAAEAQNIRRRAEQDVDKARKFALEKFSSELLPVVDNLERAIESADASHELVKALVEGVELTHKSFIDVLAKFNVEQIDPQGEPFDPQLHQAMSMVENPEVEPNTVVAVMQKGYSLNGRLVRPAMVMVSKASS